MTTPTNETQGPWGEKLWSHSSPTTTPMHRFLTLLNKKHNLSLSTYADLHAWSVANTAAFWEEVWHFTGVRSSAPFSLVLDETAPMYPRPSFFEGAKLNFAENMLYPTCGVDENSVAIVEATETRRESVTWKQLRERTAQCQRALKAMGVGKDDRVAGYVGNHANAVVAMLAATSLGAIWTGVSPDSGVQMVVDRLKQIMPRVLFADDGQVYNGKTFQVGAKVAEVLQAIESVEVAVVFDVVGAGEGEVGKGTEGRKVEVLSYEKFCRKGGEMEGEMEFAQLEPDHPVYILYSSGTTGAPKCIVHGAIGTLLQHKKEHVLHCSMLPGDKVFYFTTATWMMWHWLISCLASGATIVLYDGSPMRYLAPPTTSSAMSKTPLSEPNDLAMPHLISELQINHFGTSAKYLSLLEQKSLMPKDAPHNIDLSSLRAIYNTASPLAPSTFRYVYRAFGPDINLASITGGTDIMSLFGAGSPLNPVYAGEIQVPGLGMAIRAFDDDGKDITASGEPGDLVCIKPFPSQPVAFWGPDGAKKYQASYFDRFEGIWHHGDFVQFNPTTGGLIMLGRSDGVLNPAGVRFGSAEIYNIVLKYFSGRVADCLCVGRKQADLDEVVVLFLKMDEGQRYDQGLVDEVKKSIRAELSARHVPAIVDECPEIPFTVNGKKIEGAVKQIISGSKVKTSASVANPECLEFYKEWAANH